MNNFPLDNQPSTSSSRLLGNVLHKKRVYIAPILLLVCLVFGFAILPKKSEFSEEKLIFVQCDVGQGDAIYLNFRGYELLVDGGPNNKVLQCLERFRPQHDDILEVVVATHPDADHISGLVDVIQKYKIGVFLWNGVSKQTKIFQHLEEELKKRAVETRVVGAGDQIKLDALNVSVLWPERSSSELIEVNQDPEVKSSSSLVVEADTNARSIVLQVKFGDFNALLSGDLPDKEEARLLSLERVHSVTWLKVGHHGSSHSSSKEFLQALRPQVCTIGVGKNTYGHPSSKALESLQQVGCKIWRTDIQGDVWGSTDGSDYSMFSP